MTVHDNVNFSHSETVFAQSAAIVLCLLIISIWYHNAYVPMAKPKTPVMIEHRFRVNLNVDGAASPSSNDSSSSDHPSDLPNYTMNTDSSYTTDSEEDQRKTNSKEQGSSTFYNLGPITRVFCRCLPNAKFC